MNEILLVNPKGRRKSTAARKRKAPAKRRTGTVVVRRAAAPARRFRRNPIRGKTGRMVGDVIKSAAIGAGGVIAVEAVMSKLPLPLALQSGYGRIAAEVGVGVALGMALWKFGKRREQGVDLARGAALVGALKIARTMQAQIAPAAAATASYWNVNDNGNLMGGYFSASPTFSRPAGFGTWTDGVN